MPLAHSDREVNESQLTLMAILAHPDDETLGAGSTLARYASEGVAVHLLTATRGQAGWHGPGPHPGEAALGERREAELRCAADRLGLTSVTLLDYADGRLDEAPADEAVNRIAGHVRRLRPHVAITFGPDGVYGHVDHVAISQLATAAVVAAAAPGVTSDGQQSPGHVVEKLYYMVLSPGLRSEYSDAFGDLAMTFDGVERRPVPWPDWLITTRIEAPEHWRTVVDAIRCHASQLPTLGSMDELADEGHARLWSVRDYYRAFSRVNGGRELESDLFEGLRRAASGSQERQ